MESSSHASRKEPNAAEAAARLRVAMVIQRFRPDFSGQAVQLEELCRHLGGRGVRSIVLTAVRGVPGDREALDGWEVRRLRSDLVPGSATRSRLWMPTFAARTLAQLLRIRPDVVHVHGAPDALYAAAAYGKLTRTPVVAEMTLLGDDDPVALRRRPVRLAKLRWWLYRSCDAWIAMSRAFLPACREAGLPEDRVHVIPQGVDLERFRPVDEERRRALRREMGIPEPGKVVAFVGSVVARKGVDVLLEAWPRVLAGVPDARLLIAGRCDFPDGSAESAQLGAWLQALPEAARDRVQLTGLVDRPERILQAADAFAFPSRREGFGSVIIEAMACGLPVVVSELPGISDMILDAGTATAATPESAAAGIVVPQEDPEALAAALEKVLRDPGAARLGRAARRRARRVFDIDHVATAYRDLYLRLIRKEG